MVFGAFDGLHPGHAHFLAEAKSLGNELVVCLATDEAIKRLKGRAPKHNYDERRMTLELMPVVDKVVRGDETEGTYSAITDEQPDIIAFGYDQQALHEHCSAWLKAHVITAHTIFLHAFEPNKYKSSLLNGMGSAGKEGTG